MNENVRLVFRNALGGDQFVDTGNGMPSLTLFGSYASLKDHYGIETYNAPNGELVALPLYKLAGNPFNGDQLDSLYWTASLGTGGTTTVSTGELVLATGTTANNVTLISSNRVAPFSGLAPNKIRVPVILPDTGVVNNVREWGVTTVDENNGAIFRLSGTAFQLVTKNGGSDAVIANGSFNGQYGATFNPGTGYHFYEIIWQPRQVIWLADNKTIHTFTAGATPWAQSLHFHIHLKNANSGGLAQNVELHCRLATIARFGIPEMDQKTYFQAGLQAGIVLKRTAGRVHQLTLSAIANNAVVTLYDSLTASGALLFDTGAMGALSQPVSLNMGGAVFNTGLTLAITGAAANALVIYD